MPAKDHDKENQQTSENRHRRDSANLSFKKLNTILGDKHSKILDKQLKIIDSKHPEKKHRRKSEMVSSKKLDSILGDKKSEIIKKKLKIIADKKLKTNTDLETTSKNTSNNPKNN